MGLATVRRDKKKLEVRNGISERSYNDRKTSFYVIRYEEIERTSFNKIFWSKRKKKSKSQFGMLRKLIFLSLVSSLALYWFQWQPQGLLGNKLPAREMLIASPFTLIHIICLTNKRAIFDTYRVIRFKNELRIWISIYLLVIFWLQSQFFSQWEFQISADKWRNKKEYDDSNETRNIIDKQLQRGVTKA